MNSIGIDCQGLFISILARLKKTLKRAQVAGAGWILPALEEIGKGNMVSESACAIDYECCLGEPPWNALLTMK